MAKSIDLGGVAHIDLQQEGDYTIRKIGNADVTAALRDGWADFKAMPSHLFVLALVYPVIGLVAARWSMGNDLLPLVFPLVSGFALVGPLVAVGLYAISRRRERGEPGRWSDVTDVARSPNLPTILLLGALLLALFVGWLLAAAAIFQWQFGAHLPTGPVALLREMVGTPRGWTVMLVGNAVGFVFALVVLGVSVMSIPMALDRRVGPIEAVRASLKAFALNPVPFARWGLIVAVALALGALPFFVGLALALPVLGHATWHLYRRVIV